MHQVSKALLPVFSPCKHRWVFDQSRLAITLHYLTANRLCKGVLNTYSCQPLEFISSVTVKWGPTEIQLQLIRIRRLSLFDDGIWLFVSLPAVDNAEMDMVWAHTLAWFDLQWWVQSFRISLRWVTKWIHSHVRDNGCTHYVAFSKSCGSFALYYIPIFCFQTE
jgi:hypothetical protein